MSNLVKERQHVRPRSKGKESKNFQRHPDVHRTGVADARPGHPGDVTKATSSTIKNTVHRSFDKARKEVDVKPGEAGEETDDKDSEYDDKG